MQQRTTSGPVIGGIGEILWDVFGQDEELGGAPVNFAYHAGMLGAESYAISSIGDDRRGRLALDELRKRQMSVSYITEIPGRITGYVRATVDEAGVASYIFPDDVAWDHLCIAPAARELAPRLSAICFGSLGQRTKTARDAILGYLNSLGEGTLKVFDINIRQHFYTPELIRESMNLADVVKLNDDELRLIAGMERLDGDDLQCLRSLLRTYQLRLIVLTRGESGAILVGSDAVSDHPGLAATVVDTVGAGDSFTAATVLGLLQGWPLDRINERANQVAAWVCSRQGAMVAAPAELRIF